MTSRSGGSPCTAHPATRFVIAQSWWIASELVRRHPDLVIHESHPGGGMYDCLTGLDP
ncbi:TY-Chap2 family putative peptide chaperone [Microbacterium aurum]